MKKQLCHKELALWNERFISFNDAILRNLTFEFHGSDLALKIVVEAQDQRSPSGWSNVVIHLIEVCSAKFCDQPNERYQILSNGIHVLLQEDIIALELGYYIDDPESIAELINSPCHAVAKSLEWEAQFVLTE